MLKTMLSNIAIILFMHLCLQPLYFANKKQGIRNAVLHVIIVSFTVISLFYFPILIEEKFRFDLRAIPISFISVMHGVIFAIPVVIIASVWRFILGGAGAFPGIIFSIIIPAILSLIIRRFFHWGKFGVMKVLFFPTIIWAVCDLPFLFFVDLDINFYMMRYVTFQLSVLILFAFTKLSYHHLHLLNQFKFNAEHDSLTKLFNMKRFYEEIKALKHLNSEGGYIAMIDIDHFKKINDTYGHQTGDLVLRNFAKILLKHRQQRTIVARYGGEEFIFFKQTDTFEEALQTFEEVRKDVETSQFYRKTGELIGQVTISIGVASFPANSKLEYAVKTADEQLYKAKMNGRNQVVCSIK
ncbi:diguanylate cyclase [Heyndrickxia oleronia]|uniref:diguanylate cyclase n=1 Tax=Heyndrickxia oleronia TaxID=38875 RepID=UPI001C0E984D|nr:diguanylate cyclase [Heyndrickxia oleronia]MBU5213267.1 diguanylate cyclase [Heyndrickxia oleronia]